MKDDNNGKYWTYYNKWIEQKQKWSNTFLKVDCYWLIFFEKTWTDCFYSIITKDISWKYEIIYIYIYACVCVYLYMYVYTHLYMGIYINQNMCECIYIDIYMTTDINRYAYSYI